MGGVRVRRHRPRRVDDPTGEPPSIHGAVGRFLLGSTVVLLFPRADLRFNPAWAPDRPIRLGEAMADYGTGS